MKTRPFESLAPFLPFFDKSIKIRPFFASPSKYFSAILCFLAEISASWQHCLSGHLEKKDAAKSNRNPQKHFAHRQVPSQLRRVLSNEKPEIHTYVIFFIYEDDIKIKNKYFAAI
jgi:hypothetical protein